MLFSYGVCVCVCVLKFVAILIKKIIIITQHNKTEWACVCVKQYTEQQTNFILRLMIEWKMIVSFYSTAKAYRSLAGVYVWPVYQHHVKYHQERWLKIQKKLIFNFQFNFWNHLNHRIANIGVSISNFRCIFEKILLMLIQFANVLLQTLTERKEIQGIVSNNNRESFGGIVTLHHGGIFGNVSGY